MLKMLARWMKKFWGWFFVVFALVGLGSEYDNYKHGKTEQQGVGLVMIALFGAAGGALLRSAYKKDDVAPASAAALAAPTATPLSTTPAPAPTPVSRALRDDVIACAAQHDGKMTITDCATDLGLAFGAARDALEQCVKAGDCRSETVDGRVVYDFTKR
jgi:hypothetical protein